MPTGDSHEQLNTLQKIVAATGESQSTREIARVLKQVIERLDAQASAAEMEKVGLRAHRKGL